jgi:quinol monooxygenase YgiN
MMPDCHYGKGATVGTVLATKGAIIPAAVLAGFPARSCANRWKPFDETSARELLVNPFFSDCSAILARGEAKCVRPDARGGAMAHLELSAHMTVRPGCLDGFKKQAAELIRITVEKDTHTLRYDWFLSLDGTECEVREAYTGPEGLIEHNHHILDARTKLFRDYADSHFMTVYGEVSEPLLNLLETHAVGHKWFSFLQGLEPSAEIPPQILAAAREAKQPV